MKNLEGSTQETLQEDIKKLIDFWRELITKSGISLEYQEKFLKILNAVATRRHHIEYLDNFGTSLLYGWAGILTDKSRDIFKYDDEVKRQKKYGQMPSIKLSSEDHVLFNLYSELREDVLRAIMELNKKHSS